MARGTRFPTGELCSQWPSDQKVVLVFLSSEDSRDKIAERRRGWGREGGGFINHICGKIDEERREKSKARREDREMRREKLS